MRAFLMLMGTAVRYSLAQKLAAHGKFASI